MAKKQTLQKEIREKTDAELHALINSGHDALRAERFKDKFSRKAGLIRATKRQIARAHTELNARRTADNTK